MKLLLVCCSILLALSLGACNTVSGLGQDIGAAGTAIKETAQKTKDKMAK